MLGSSQSAAACSTSLDEGSGASSGPGMPGGPGSWIATSYGPQWGIQGNRITATGLHLAAGQPAYEVAVDPRVIALRSYVHVQPNPFGTSSAFYAGDTGGAIVGKHVDIYDWRRRASQDAWGTRTVTVTPAPNPGAGNLLGGVAPTPPTPGAGELRSGVVERDGRAHTRPDRA